MHECMCGCACMHMCECRGQRSHSNVPHGHSPSHILRSHVSRTLISLSSQTGWPVSSKDPHLNHANTAITDIVHRPGFYAGNGNLHSDLHMSVADTLLVKDPSPQPQHPFFCNSVL